MIRPRLEYATVVWSPHWKKDLGKLERIHRITTQKIPELSSLIREKTGRTGPANTRSEKRRGDLIPLYRNTVKWICSTEII